MKKISFIFLSLFVILLGTVLVLLNIEIKKDNEIVYFSLSEGLGRFDEVTCYDDGISYDKKLDISVTGIDQKKILFFYKITLEYEEGNLCDYEYYLEEDYIIDVINNAKIEENTKNINLKKLIAGKEAIVGNTRYTGNDYETSMDYILNGEYQTLYIFYIDDVLVIQVGHSDEGPKFIAYK